MHVYAIIMQQFSYLDRRAVLQGLLTTPNTPLSSLPVGSENISGVFSGGITGLWPVGSNLLF